MYYRDADGAILVYDVTDKESFDNLKNIWIKDLLDKAPENI
jgi:GTPase SAR1 family protein